MPEKLREEAITTQLAGMWRLEQANYSYLLCLYNARNAFPSARLNSMYAAVDTIVGQEERIYLQDHSRYAHIELPVLGHEKLHMEVHCGARMGHVRAPTLFCMDYNRCIDQWAKDTKDDEAMLLLANKDPVTAQVTDGGLTVYVDDVSRMVPKRPQETFEVLEARAQKMENGLQTRLAD